MKLHALYVHPIKSCRAISVERAIVTPRGLQHDRRWMVVDEAGKFLTQRTVPRMTRVRVRIGDVGLLVDMDELPTLALPFLHSNGCSIDIDVWDYHGPAIRHDAGSAWFTRALAQPAQLVCMPDSIVRPVAKDAARPEDHVSFADAYPFLVANSASLDDLNARANGRFDMRRFRPNLVVDGAPAWDEDEWRVMRVGAILLRLPSHCARCNVPSLDPESGEATREPLRTLASFRRRDREVYFGMNGIADDVGLLQVGDEVTVLERV